MTDETNNDTPPVTESEAQRRERRSFPVRALRNTESGWQVVPGLSWTTIEQAEAWVRQAGDDGQTYLLARVIGARRVLPRSVVEVEL